MRYTQGYDYEWIDAKKHLAKMMCCDCGLVHKVKVRIKKGRIQIQAIRDKRATAAARRSKRFK